MLFIPVLFRSVVTLLKKNRGGQSQENAAYLVTEQIGDRTFYYFGSKAVFMTISKHTEKAVSTFAIGMEPHFRDVKIIRTIMQSLIRGAKGGRLIQVGVEKCRLNTALDQALSELKFLKKEMDIQEGELKMCFVVFYKNSAYDIENPPFYIKIKTQWKRYLKKVFRF